MQREVKKTKVTVTEDFPTSISSSIYGANLDVIAFNMSFIAKQKPELVPKIIQVYEVAHKLKGVSDGNNNN